MTGLAMDSTSALVYTINPVRKLLVTKADEQRIAGSYWTIAEVAVNFGSTMELWFHGSM